MKKQRIKGETAQPVNVLKLIDKVGVTKAAKDIGTSTTTLHKARENGLVSKPIEVAAGAILGHLGDVATSPAPRQIAPVERVHVTQPVAATRQGDAGEPTVVVLIEIPVSKEPVLRQLGEKVLNAKEIMFTN
jgi:hypothetical protein